MPITFHRNAYCEVLQPDGQWYRSTVQGGPYVGNNGAPYYKVHVHHPVNHHDLVWANSVRPDPYCEGRPGDCYNYHAPEPSVPCVYAASQSNAVPKPDAHQSFLQRGGLDRRSNGPPALSMPTAQPVVPSKRPLEREQQAVAPTSSTQFVQPTLQNANGTATGAEPAAKRQALSPPNMSAAQNAGQDKDGGPHTCKTPAAAFLEGPAVEVKVTMEAFEKSWHLPRALLSHVSPYFRAVIQDSLGASASIKLEDFNPTAFATFVQWMYYGTYDPQLEVPGPPVGAHHIDAWILGDKAEAPAFQDLAMSHIFSQYDWLHRPLTTSTLLRVCAKTAVNAPLRLLLLDILAQNFKNQERVHGTLEEWDVALQEYPDARLALLGSLRAQGARVKSEKDYSVATVRSNTGRETRSSTASEAGRLQLNMSTLPKIKTEIKKEPEAS